MIKTFFLLSMGFITSSMAMHQNTLCESSWIEETSSIIIIATIDWPKIILIPIQPGTTVNEIKTIATDRCIVDLKKKLNNKKDIDLAKNTKLCAYYRTWKTLKLWNHISDELSGQELIKKYMKDWNTNVFSFFI